MDIENGKYILCYVSDGRISPEGDGKSYNYASQLLDLYNEYGRIGFRLFKLVPIDHICKDCMADKDCT